MGRFAPSYTCTQPAHMHTHTQTCTCRHTDTQLHVGTLRPAHVPMHTSTCIESPTNAADTRIHINVYPEFQTLGPEALGRNKGTG